MTARPRVIFQPGPGFAMRISRRTAEEVHLQSPIRFTLRTVPGTVPKVVLRVSFSASFKIGRFTGMTQKNAVIPQQIGLRELHDHAGVNQMRCPRNPDTASATQESPRAGGARLAIASILAWS
jgi:hypothetical protein